MHVQRPYLLAIWQYLRGEETLRAYCHGPYRLRFTDQPVTGVAFEAGYEIHEAFTRAFRAMFDDSPTGFRKARRATPVKSVPSGVHYVADGRPEVLEPPTRGGQPVQATIERLEPMNVVFMRHIGPYDAVGEIWGKLFFWAGRRGLLGGGWTAVGVAYDDPDVTPPERIRCDVCLVVDHPVEPEGEVAMQKIGGGEYAVTRHVGSYDQLGDTYARMFGQWLPAGGREPRSAPALEFYRNSPMDTEPEKLITDIYVPLEEKS